MQQMQILSGDIGGTKTRIALIELHDRGVEVRGEKTYRSSDYKTLEQLLGDFLAGIDPIPRHAGFGVAGPVRENRSVTTNLPWIIDANEISRQFQVPDTFLLNDLEATAWGIKVMGGADICELHPGTPDPLGNLGIIAAGTGLGEAGVFRGHGAFQPFAAEGGHADFAPTTELEFALLQYLSQRLGHVSWERIVSGMGIANIYQFLCHYKSVEIPGWLAAEIEQDDAAAAVSRAAEAGRCALCEKAMNLFVRLYGREAGNHALKVMATGGVYIGGGIAPKILERLKEPAFLENFFAKGRMEPLMRNMPVRIILNDRAALFGPAVAARDRIAEGAFA